MSYCVRCKKQTGDKNATLAKAKNGRTMKKSTCATCGGKKSSFVAAKSGGFIGSLVSSLF
jgi:hypothetical protein